MCQKTAPRCRRGGFTPSQEATQVLIMKRANILCCAPGVWLFTNLSRGGTSIIFNFKKIKEIMPSLIFTDFQPNARVINFFYEGCLNQLGACRYLIIFLLLVCE